MRLHLFTLGTLFCMGGSLLADEVITLDGARLTGDITRIDEGIIYLETPYADTIRIKQDQVASFETSEPVAVRLESGTTMAGAIEPAADGRMKITAEDGVLEADIADVVSSWDTGAEDPYLVRTRRNWRFNAGVDLLGKSGNAEEFALGINLDAQLKGPNDELRFFAEYEQREQEDEKTADRAAGGTSYESFFSEHYGWYARTELETDAIEQVDLRSTTGVGFSFRLINKDHQTLVARSGLGYRHTVYETEGDDESSATLDFGLRHTYRFEQQISMVNEITYVPALDDFGRYRAVHDSALEIPVGSGDRWKIRMGIKHEYESEPVAEENLDTTYYTRMIFSWN